MDKSSLLEICTFVVLGCDFAATQVTGYWVFLILIVDKMEHGHILFQLVNVRQIVSIIYNYVEALFLHLALNPDNECPLFSVDNGKVIITHTGYGGIANVSCHSCYELKGPSTLRCIEDGNWNNIQPTCQST